MLGLKIFVPVQTHNFCHSAVRFIIYWTISIFQAFFSPISSAIKLKVFLVLKARVKCLFPKTTPPHRLLLQEISKFSEKNLKTLNGSCFKEWCWKFVHILDNNLIRGKSFNSFQKVSSEMQILSFCLFFFLFFRLFAFLAVRCSA